MIEIVFHLIVLWQAQQIAVLHIHQILWLQLIITKDIFKIYNSRVHRQRQETPKTENFMQFRNINTLQKRIP